MLAAYGLAEGAATADSFGHGEGLVGQCALERKPLTLTGLPPDYIRIASGLGTAAPLEVLAYPLASPDRLPRSCRNRWLFAEPPFLSWSSFG